MLATIEFDNDHGLKANEVADVNTNWMLPSELVAVQLPSALAAPKALLGLCQVLAQLAGEVNHPG